MYMYVIFVDAHLFNVDVGKKLLEFFRYQDFEICIYALAQDFSSIPRDPDNVILGLIYRVCLLQETHVSMLARCGTGSHPRPYRRGVLAGLNSI